MPVVVTGLTDEQLTGFELRAEAAMLEALQVVADTVADQIAAITIASAVTAPARQVWAGCPRGLHDPHPGPCPTGGGGVAVLVAADPPPVPDIPGPPGQPYVSPDDLAAMGPLWNQQVQQTLMPVVAEVYQFSGSTVHAQLVDAARVPFLPPVSTLAAEQYLSQAAATFATVGNTLAENARNSLLDGFKEGDSIPELAARVRGSAQMTAPTAVMYARTEVLDASNAGSYNTAKASGLALRKGWFATPDPRTRPSHVTAGVMYGRDDQFIPLADQFQVGGYPCERPHDPALPPAERSRCRCTIGYSVGAQAAAPIRRQEVPPLPGEAGEQAARNAARIAEIEAQGAADVERVFAEVDEAARRAGIPPVPGGPSPMGRAVPGLPGSYAGLSRFTVVRPELRTARTRDELAAAMRTEMRRITDKEVVVEVPPDASMASMREFYEGVLLSAEQFPDTRLRAISWFTRDVDPHYAEADDQVLSVNAWWFSQARRPTLLARVRKDAADWDVGAPGWMPRNAGSVDALGRHEYGHVVHLSLGTETKTVSSRALSIVQRHATAEQVTPDTLTVRQLGAYASKDEMELVAGAYTDVTINGDAAAVMSREIVDELGAAYRRSGGQPGNVPSPVGLARAAELPEDPAAAFDRAVTVAKTDDDALRAAPSGLADSSTPRNITIDRGLTDAQAEVVQAYRGVFGYRRVNDALRAGDEITDEIRTLDSAMASSRLTDDVIVWRGVRDGRELFGADAFASDLTGANLSDLAYMSTSQRLSVARNVARHGFGSEKDPHDPLVMRILAPRGTGAVEVSNTELLLDRGLTLRVIADRGVVDGARRLDLEIVPAAARAQAAPARSVAQLRKAVADAGQTIPTGLRTYALRKLVVDLERGVDPERARADAVRSILVERQTVAEALRSTEELVANGGSRRALAAVAARLRLSLEADPAKTLRPLLDAMDTGDPDAIRAAAVAVARAGKLKPVGAAQTVAPMDRTRMLTIGSDDVPAGGAVRVIRPGYETTFEGQTTLLSRAAVVRSDVPLPVKATKAAPRKAVTPDLRPVPGRSGVDRVPRPHETPSATDVAHARTDIVAKGVRFNPYNRTSDARTPFLAEFRERYPSTFARVVQEERSALEMQRWAKQFNVTGTTAEIKAAVEREIRQNLATGQLVVRQRTLASQRGILRAGRMKNQFETRGSSAAFDPSGREAYERAMWGYADDVNPADRPIFGYMSAPDLDESAWHAFYDSHSAMAKLRKTDVRGFGDVRWVLKDEVRDRTSFTVGDSFFGGEFASPMKDPDWKSFKFRTLGDDPPPPGSDWWSPEFQWQTDYVEIQIHGGVTLDDVREVIFDNTPPSDVVELLAQRGIPWRLTADLDMPLPVAPVKAAKVAAKKAPAKAAAPKPPPAPDRMTPAALRTELRPIIDAAPDQWRLTPADLATVPKPTLANWTRRARELDPRFHAEEVGRWRQVIIDRQRAVAELLAEADELIANQASASAMGIRARGRLRRIEAQLAGWPGEASARAVVSAMATGNQAAIRRAVVAAQRKLGLRQLGDNAGTVGRYDRAGMSPIGDTIPEGAPVIVVRPGYEIEIGGQRVTLMRPVVQEFTPPTARTARELMAGPEADRDAALRAVYEGKFGRYTTKVTTGADIGRTTARGRRIPDSMFVEGKIYNAKGVEVGRFGRTIEVDEGTGQIWVHNSILEFDNARDQGSGFAREFNDRAMNWYRQSGVHGVYLDAVDVGKYAWASQGFDFASPPTIAWENLRALIAAVREGRNRNQYGDLISARFLRGPNMDAQLAAAEDILERASRYTFGQPGYPTAREISQIGRWAGAGKNDRWIGKELMLNTVWTGQLIL